MITRVESGSVAIETNVSMTPRERISLRASARRLDKALDRLARQTRREIQKYFKTPAGQKELVDLMVKNLLTQQDDNPATSFKDDDK